MLSVRELRLYYPNACPAFILQFISVFANLRDTVIHAPRWTTTSNRENNPITPYTLRGDLHLSGLGEDAGPFFSLLASQATWYERIVLDECALGDFYPLQLFVSNTGMSLRSLYIFAEGDRKFGALFEARTCLDVLFHRQKRGPAIIVVRLHSP